VLSVVNKLDSTFKLDLAICSPDRNDIVALKLTCKGEPKNRKKIAYSGQHADCFSEGEIPV
jgi:hypothetical protein